MKEEGNDILLKILHFGVLLHIAGYLIVSNVTLHRNLFYGFVVIPFVILGINKIRSLRLSKYDFKTLLTLLVVTLLYLTTTVLWGADTEQTLPQSAKNLLFILCFIGSTALVFRETTPELQNLYLLIAVITTTLYLTLIIFSFWYASVHRDSEFEALVRQLGIRGYAELKNESYYRGGWSLGFPRLDIGSNDLNSPIYAGMFYSINLLAGIYLLTNNYLSKLQLAIVSICCVCLFSGVILTQSRGPLISLLLTLLFTALFNKRVALHLFIGSTVTIIIMTLAALNFEALATSLRIKAVGDSVRVQILQSCISEGLASPIFGIGYSVNHTVLTPTAGTFAHCHNLIIDTFLFSGFTGAILVSLVIIAFARKALLQQRHSFFTWLFMYGVVFFQFDGTYLSTKPNPTWLVFWLPIGVMLGGYNAQIENNGPKVRAPPSATRKRKIKHKQQSNPR